MGQSEGSGVRVGHAGYRRRARENEKPNADAGTSHGVADMAAVECPSSLIRATGEIALGIPGARPSDFRNGCSFTFIGSEHTVGNCLVRGLCAGILAREIRAVVAVDAATRF
ncbi:hypothetical protein GOACH_25_00530 [Gordonia aichiensis NBRC 108223]|uniref:Uncharacterized protein n=1 Tax=Gordonia aichiensis NBRC 108223 TaxID=1220583 RepID=L7KPV2_9ACTN|nr:hypothetical protein GOACH_25_00530 [Gordonia aichiensis NBRC 108223]